MFPYYGFQHRYENEVASEIVEQVWNAGGSVLEKKVRLDNKLQVMLVTEQISEEMVARLTIHNEWVHARLNGYEPKMVTKEEFVDVLGGLDYDSIT